MLRKIRKVSLVALCLLIVGALYFYHNYKGFTRGMLNQVSTATVAENRNLFFCLSYWMQYIQLLQRDDATGIYGFTGIDESGLNDFERGKLAFHRGQFAESISLIESDIQKSGESESKLFWLAVCYMRQAEAENCLVKLTGDGASPSKMTDMLDAQAQLERAQVCALPLTQFHYRVESSRQAAKLFEKLLDTYDSSNRLYQWLLNFSHMTVGDFPDGVPARYRINSDFIDTFYGEKKRAVEAAYAQLSFTDRAKELGVDTNNTGRGVAVEDFDRDGYLDIITGGSFEDVRYYRNDGGRKFVDQTAAAGLEGITQPFVITAADYDNDGWMDVFFARPFGNYSLYRNNRDGTFTDVTQAAGLLDGKSEGLTWMVTET